MSITKYKPNWTYISKFIKFSFNTNKIKFSPIWEVIPSWCSINYFYKTPSWWIWVPIDKNLEININETNWIYYKIELTWNEISTPILEDLKITYYNL